ncbi:unnamed protein product [Cylindrotheca closterium]|uniref:Uncharacterized protein n=1 Tax=Cylindrotheca closterium TaxID=2856 RepID=A0AAD2G4K1_9STRA|nr:unnamed protein product [Cylindrotheca closterium]
MNSDNSQLTKYVIAVVDTETMEVNPSEEIWSLRILAMRISLQNPFSFFGIDEFEDKPDDNHFFSGEWNNPRLRLEHPLVGFWLICSELFDYPRINEFLLEYYDDPPSAICPTVVFDLATAQRVITTDKKSPRFWEFSLMFDPTLIVQRAEPLTWMWLAAAKFFAHPWTGPAIIPPIVEEFERLERESKIAKAQSKSKKRPASTPENPKGAKAHDSRPSPSVQMQTELTPPKGRSNPYQRTPPSDATPPRQQVVMSDAVHVIAGTPTGTQEASVPADDVVVANTHRGRTSAENEAEEHNSAPTYRDTVAALPAPTVPLTTDERLMRLLAVHWNASPFRHITIFNVSVVFDWQGVGSSEFNQVQTAYNAFHQFASGVWGEITSTVVLLPFADGRFTRQQLWIRNLKEFDEKAKDWAHLKLYLDPNFGNPYILNKPGKTGSKTYKTRMRFGMDTAPPILMQELRSILSSEPRAGVFPTPIQVSDMVRLGFLPLLPQELAIGPYCKDLMRLCDFQYPIGLMQEWVNNPQFFSAKFTGSSRGLLCWHVFVPKAFAREADPILAANLDLRKPSCAPFQAPTHYTRDWQAAKDELDLGKQCPQLQSLIEAMRERTRATLVLTAIYRIPIELPGMLTSAATENFGRLTLLRFLLAVIVTGAQAKKAEDAEPKKPPTKALDVLSDSESSGDNDDDDSPLTFEWTTIIKKSLVASTPKPVEDKKKSLLMAPKSPEDDDAWIDQLAQMDLTNDRPSPLFVMILPAEEDGCYFVVVRQRYLPLAMNVLDNLPSFLQFHLGESSFPNFIRVIKNWSATDLAYQNRKLHVEWVPSELRSRCIDNPTDNQGPRVRDPMDFLLCMEDPVEILEGTLHIDIHAKHVRDVDDGLSVIGHLNNWNESQAQLQTALQTIETITDEKNSLNRDLQSVRDELEAMKAAQETAAAMTELSKTVRPVPMLTVDVPTGPPGQTRVSTTTLLSPSVHGIAPPATAHETDGENGEDQPNASSPMDTGRGGIRTPTTGP